MWTIPALLTLLIATPLIAGAVLVGTMLGARDVPGSLVAAAPRIWSWLLCKASGVRVVLHAPERLADGAPQVYVANHVSWYDVFTIAATLRSYKFIAKEELGRIPLFGHAARAAGIIFIDRNNRKAAFAGYEAAAGRIREGFSVVVCPEGTRGDAYALRPFKKGPFVLAIAAGVPVIPTLVYGTREVLARGSWVVRRGTVHVHLLEPIPTAGMTYEDRDRLARLTWERMAAELESVYGIASAGPGKASPVLEPATT